MTAGVLEIRCDSVPMNDAWLAHVLETATESGRARVVIIDATALGGERPEFSPAALAAPLKFELPALFVFESALAGSLTDLALACDIRICGGSASMKGRLRSNARARALTDEATALALYLGSEILDSSALLDHGLVSSVTAPGAALAEARRLGSVIASRGPIATRLGKEAIWRGLAQPLEQALRFETDLTLLLQTTKDRAEGVRAFNEKRAPVFKGE